MQVRVYDWEYFDRGKLWYISFVTFIAFFMIISLIIQNFSWIVVLFLLLWWYILLHLLPAWKKINLAIAEEWLKIWWTFHPWSKLTGFVLEIDINTQSIKNIVLLMWNFRSIHTFADDAENIKPFILALWDIVPMLDWYEQTFVDKLVRKLKI